MRHWSHLRFVHDLLSYKGSLFLIFGLATTQWMDFQLRPFFEIVTDMAVTSSVTLKLDDTFTSYAKKSGNRNRNAKGYYHIWNFRHASI